VSAKLGRPVSDEMWADLVEQGFVDDADGKPPSERSSYLVDRIKQLMAVANSMSAASRSAPSDRPRGTAATARIDALSAVYAAWAAAETDVQQFRKRQLVRRDTAEYLAHVQGRGPHPGYELLAPEQVAAWVTDHYDRAGGEQHIRKLVMDMEVDGPDPTTDLSYIDGKQERRLTVDAGGPLGRLAKLTEKLADWYRWAPAGATDFVLTGRTPEVFVYVGSAQIRYSIDSSATTRVTMTLDPFLTPEQVAGIYARLRAKLSDNRQIRSQSVKYYRLAEHVGPHVRFYVEEPGKVRRAGRPPTCGPTGLAQFIDPIPGNSWSALCHDWNTKYSDVAEDGRSWRYEHLSNFTRDAQDALRRLLDPGWRMWNR
jgi:hypothetical protein